MSLNADHDASRVGCGCGHCDECWRNAGCPAVWPLPKPAPAEPQPCGRIASATHCCEYHGIHSDDDFAAARIKLDGARQILERLRHCAVPVELSRRIEHWLASATPSKEERLQHHLTQVLVAAAVQWSAHEGRVAAVDTEAATAAPHPFDQPLRTPLLEAFLDAAHQLRAAGEQ